MNPLIVLDRDGVINRDSDDFIRSVEAWQPLPGSLEAIARLSAAGARVAIATNQSGIARGYFDLATLRAMHERLEAGVTALGGRIEAIEFCPHGPDDGCSCRKPLPGLLHRIETRLDASANGAVMVGDSRRDLEAGLAAGARPVLVLTGKGPRTAERIDDLGPVDVFADLAAFADDWIARHAHGTT